jgi:hypothetical protein
MIAARVKAHLQNPPSTDQSAIGLMMRYVKRVKAMQQIRALMSGSSHGSA